MKEPSMEWDDLKPKKTTPPPQIGESLEPFGIGELEVRLLALEQEITRVKAELMKKKAHCVAASALFKS